MKKRLTWLLLAGVAVLGSLALFHRPETIARRALTPLLRRGLRAIRHPAPAATPGRPLVLGYNVEFPGDGARLTPFIDRMHDAGPWSGSCSEVDPRCDPASHLDLDEQGWPRSLRYKDDPSRAYADIQTTFSTHASVADVGKVFVVTWEGEGSLGLSGVEPATVDTAKRMITFVFRPGHKLLRIEKTDPKGNGRYVRNIRIFRQDREHLLADGEIFNPEMLDFLKSFQAIRFADWMQSNAEEKRDAVWSERPRFEYFHWCGQALDATDPSQGQRIGGYPVEVLVALANKIGAHPHFTMPYRYTDDWLIQFATYVRDHLSPQLRATVEYSNEVWNRGLPQGAYATENARLLWPNETTAALQYMGMRAAKMGALWRKVFAGQEARLRVVIAPQTGWPDVASASLDCPKVAEADPARRPCHAVADAIAITAYFDGHLQDKINSPVLRDWMAKGKSDAIARGLRQLQFGDLAEIRNQQGDPAVGGRSESLDHAIDLFDVFHDMAAERKLELYVYAGGTAFGSDDPDINKLLVDIAEDPSMADLYKRLFSELQAAGGTVFNCWGWLGPHDPWAEVPSLLDRKRTKYRRVLQAAQARRP